MKIIRISSIEILIKHNSTCFGSCDKHLIGTGCQQGMTRTLMLLADHKLLSLVRFTRTILPCATEITFMEETGGTYPRRFNSIIYLGEKYNTKDIID